MRWITLLSLLLVLADLTQAQMPAQPPVGRLLGTVQSSDGRPLKAAAVTIRAAADSSLVAGALTGEDGRFLVTGLRPGRYTVRISVIGHEAVTLPATTINATQLAVDLGRVNLAVAAVAVTEVQATVQRAPVVLEADRTVYNTREMPAVEGGTAADVLRHIAELEVDFNGRVTMRGNQSVAIHINGRPAPMQGEQLQEFIKQMPGRAISKVEVMPNPSAKYDPEGMGGIVNIVLRADAGLGLSGSLGANANTRGDLGLTSRLAWQQGRMTIFGGGSISFGEHRSSTAQLRQSLLSAPASFYQQDSRMINDDVIGFGDFSAEYRAGTRTTAWLNGYVSSHGHDSRRTIAIGVYNEPGQYLDQYTRSLTSENPHAFLDWGIGIKHQVEARRHELTVDLRRTTNDGGTFTDASTLDGADAVQTSFERLVNDQDEGARTLTFRADYVRPWGKRGDLSAGVSLAQRNIAESALAEWFASPGPGDPAQATRTGFLYEEDVNALYATAGQAWGRVTVRAGLRGEFAQTDFSISDQREQFDNQYNSVFPNLNLAYEIDKARTIRIGYSKRVGRPPTYFLNPHQALYDPATRMEGNPHLGPNYTHTVNADFSWIGRRGTLRIAPYFRRTVDSWEEIRSVDTAGVMLTTWMNGAAVQQGGVNFTLAAPANGRVGGSTTFSVFHNRTDATNLSADYTRSALRWSASSTLTAKVSDLLIGTANLNYMAPRDLPQGRQAAMVNSSIGLRQQLLSKKATLNLFINDPLALHRFELQTRDRTHMQLARTVPRVRTATLSFTYNFGRAPQSQSRRDTEAPGSN